MKVSLPNLAGYRLPASLNRKIGQAMHDFAMFSEGNRVLVAVSGGVDSLVLAFVLQLWRAKAPINFELIACHIDHGFWQDDTAVLSPAETIGKQLQDVGLSLHIVRERSLSGEARTCFLCARHRRHQLFDLAREFSCTSIAFGHHKDDLIETFLLNAVYSGNISTMVPKQELFAGTLSLIRPLAYLGKEEVMRIGDELGVKPVKNLCPLAEDTKREKIRHFLGNLYQEEPGARASLFSALSNIRKEYLL